MMLNERELAKRSSSQIFAPPARRNMIILISLLEQYGEFQDEPDISHFHSLALHSRAFEMLIRELLISLYTYSASYIIHMAGDGG